MPAVDTSTVPLGVTRVRGTVVVTVHGELDCSGASYLGTVLDDLIDGQGNLRIVLDLRDLASLDCATMEAVAVATHKIARRGGELALRGSRPVVHEARQP